MVVDTGFDVDDVIEAHELLKDYSGNFDGLFSAVSIGPEITEWRLLARCPFHGDVWNAVSIPAYQGRPSAAAYVLCPPCYEMGIARRLAPYLVVRITMREST